MAYKKQLNIYLTLLDLQQQFFIAFILSLILSYAGNTALFYPSTPIFIKRFSTPITVVSVLALLWALMGLVFGFGSTVYSIRKWSYLKHSFIVFYVGFTPLVVLAGWLPISWVNMFIFKAEFIVIFLVFWAFYYWKTAREIKRINQKIKKQ